MAEFLRLKLTPLEEQLKAAQSERKTKSEGVRVTRGYFKPFPSPFSSSLDAPKPKRQALETPPNKPSITKSGVAIIKDCCGATQCAVM